MTYRLTVKYSPNQPRHPAGTEAGGRFAPKGGGAGVEVFDGTLNAFLGDAVDRFAHQEHAAYTEAGHTRKYADEIEGLYRYQGIGYRNMNFALRHPEVVAKYLALIEGSGSEYDSYETRLEMFQKAGGTQKQFNNIYPSSLRRDISELPSLVKGFKEKALPLREGTVYRSFRNAEIFDTPENFVGKSFTEKGFSSTTIKGSFATGWKGDLKDTILLRVTTTPKDRGLYLPSRDFEGGAYEYEVLIPPGTTYRINKATKTKNGLVLDAVIEPSRQKADYTVTVKYSPDQPRLPAGTPGGGRWTSGGSSNIPRTAMPQILSKDLPHFFEYAKSKGVKVTNEKVSATRLQFRQAVDPAHAKSMPAKALAKPILVSRDFFVLDGNHRAAANAALGRRVNIHRVHKPFKEAIDFMFTYPGVLNLNEAQEARKYDPNQPRAPGGTPNGGQWVAGGGAGGYTVSDKMLSPLLYDKEDVVMHVSGVEAHKDALALHEELKHTHLDARDTIAGVDLYQSSYYREINLMLRFPDEYEEFISLVNDDDYLPDHEYYNKAHKAFGDSGLAKASGKTLADFQFADIVDMGEWPYRMVEHMRERAPVLPEGTALYRSFRHADMLDNPEKYVGSSFTEKGFSSTTADPYFAARWNTGGRKIVMRTTTTGKERGLYLARERDNGPYELEVLLPAGTTYRINKITQTPTGDLVVDADITG